MTTSRLTAQQRNRRRALADAATGLPEPLAQHHSPRGQLRARRTATNLAHRRDLADGTLASMPDLPVLYFGLPAQRRRRRRLSAAIGGSSPRTAVEQRR